MINTANMSLKDINWFIPHSDNKRIIEEMCVRLNFPLEKTLMSIEYFGNTSSASISLALWIAIEVNKKWRYFTIIRIWWMTYPRRNNYKVVILNIIDVGCGTGALCSVLNQRGFLVYLQ